MNVVAYVRYATVAIGDKLRIGNNPQENAIQNYCYANNVWLMETFRDIGVGGLDFERQGWKDMEEYLLERKGIVEYIMVTDYARIGRDAHATLKMIAFLEQEYDVKIFPLSDNNLLSENEYIDILSKDARRDK